MKNLQQKRDQDRKTLSSISDKVQILQVTVIEVMEVFMNIIGFVFFSRETLKKLS